MNKDQAIELLSRPFKNKPLLHTTLVEIISFIESVTSESEQRASEIDQLKKSLAILTENHNTLTDEHDILTGAYDAIKEKLAKSFSPKFKTGDLVYRNHGFKYPVEYQILYVVIEDDKVYYWLQGTNPEIDIRHPYIPESEIFSSKKEAAQAGGK